MNRSVDVEVGSFGEAKGLGNDALSANGGVSVNLHIDNLILAVEQYFGPRFTHRDWVLSLQMRGVMDERNLNLFIAVLLLDTVSHMRSNVIDDVSELKRGVSLSSDLSKEVLCLVVEDVDQGVEPPSVRHSKNQVFIASLGAEVEQFVESDDSALGAFSGVPFEVAPFFVQEVVECFGFD